MQLEAGFHRYPWNLAFPSSVWQMTGILWQYLATDLPPTMKMNSPGLKAKVVYDLVLKVRRPGRFARTLQISRNLRVHLPNPRPLPPVYTSQHMTRVASIPCSRFQQQQMPPLQAVLPEYSPLLQLKLAILRTVLCPNAPLRLFLSIVFPPMTPQCNIGLVLRFLRIQLRTATLANTGSAARVEAMYHTLCSVTPVVPVAPKSGTAIYEADPALWDNPVVPRAAPSFASLGLSRTHDLQVSVGLSSRERDDIEVSSIL